MTEQAIIDNGCGRKVTTDEIPPNDPRVFDSYKTTLHLCAWHSRWILKADKVVTAGEPTALQRLISQLKAIGS